MFQLAIKLMSLLSIKKLDYSQTSLLIYEPINRHYGRIGIAYRPIRTIAIPTQKCFQALFLN